MLRKYFSFSIAIVLIYLLSICVLAHPGNTDASGGHINKSTGEYHYHHGYSEHDHRDMDGDGDLDCPYKFKDATDHSSDNDSGSDLNAPTQTTPKNNATKPTKENKTYPYKENKTYSYIAISFVVVFFVLVNCFAIHIDKTDNSKEDEQLSFNSVFISILSTIIVFSLMFYVVYIFKQPIQLRSLSFTEMLQVLFFSALLGSLVWTFTNWISGLLNILICTIFKVEVCGWFCCFQRLTLPLSYALTVFIFILK